MPSFMADSIPRLRLPLPAPLNSRAARLCSERFCFACQMPCKRVHGGPRAKCVVNSRLWLGSVSGATEIYVLETILPALAIHIAHFGSTLDALLPLMRRAGW